jgi:hypothetical protein
MVGGHTRHVAKNQIRLLYTLFSDATLLGSKGASTLLYHIDGFGIDLKTTSGFKRCNFCFLRRVCTSK